MKNVPWLEVAVGACFVLVYSLGRFSEPTTNRSSTTAFRYYSGAGIYSLAYLTVYAAFVRFQELIPELAKGTGFPDSSHSLSSPFVAALVLTVALPNSPLLNSGDQKLRKWINDLVSIPGEALRLSEQLLRAALRPNDSALFEPDDETRLAVEAFFQQADIPKDAVRFARDGSIEATLTYSTALYAAVANDFELKAQLQRGSEWNSLDEDRKSTLSTARGYLAAMNGNGRQASDLVHFKEWERYVALQVREYFGELCLTVSRAILQRCVTLAARDAKLSALGFRIGVEPRLTFDQLMLAFLLQLVATFAGHVWRGDAMIIDMLGRSVVLSAAGTGAIACATIPKGVWKFTDRGHSRPWAFYFAAVLGAVAMSFALIYLLLLLRYLNLTSAWTNFHQLSGWGLMAGVIAFMVAYQCDSRPSALLPRAKLRLLEGAASSVALLLAALVLYWEYEHRASAEVEYAPHAPSLFLGSLGLGFLLGYCIPTWFREQPEPSPAPESRLRTHEPPSANVQRAMPGEHERSPNEI